MAVLGQSRFMPVNLITSSTALTASSQAAGLASRPQKSGAGSSVMTVGGTYSNNENLDYVVKIESTGDIGTATFKWSSNGGQSWAATGVGTSTSPVTLSNGLTVSWATGSGDDVVLDDEWTFKGFHPYHRMYLLDRDRDTEWRSSDASGTITLSANMGSAQTVNALVLMDHNFTSGATIQLQASAASDFSSLALNLTVPWQATNLLYYVPSPAAYQYWRLAVTDGSNPTGYLRASELCFSTYIQLTLTYALGDTQGKARMGRREQTLSGKFYGQLNTVVRNYDLSWIRMSATDRDTMIGIFDSLNNLTTRQVLPVFFNPDSNDLSKISLCEWQEGTVQAANEVDAPERYTVPVRLEEVPRTI